MVGHSFALTASLLVGQVQDVQIVSHSHAAHGSCNCESSAPLGGLFSRGRSWTWQGPALGSWNAQERPIISRIQGMFRGNSYSYESYSPTYVSHSSGTEVASGRCCGQQNPLMSPVGAGGHVPIANESGSMIPQGPSSPDAPQLENLKRMPTKVSLSEPPLIEKTATSGIKPATFKEPSIAPLPATEPATEPANASLPDPVSARFAGKIGHEENYLWVTGQLEVVNGTAVIHYAPMGVADRFGGRVTLSGQVDLSNFHDGDLVTVRGSILPGPSGVHFYRVSGINLIERGGR